MAELVDPYILLLTLIGVLVLALAGLPLLVRGLPLSVPVILLGMGGLFAAVSLVAPLPNPQDYAEFTERATEFLVIVALTGAGLKLDTPLGWRTWGVTWRLLGITMPLSIAAIALAGWGMLGLAPATALLLGAVLAPTDPVLAADVQVGGPGQGDDPRVRFALTSEAGLNDSLAFPFVHLAIAFAMHDSQPGVWLFEWLAVDVVWKLAAGIAVGWAAGRLAGWLLFRLAHGVGLAHGEDGFVAVGLTLLAYGLTEMVHGYGFIGVFVAALVLRSVERDHSYHQRLHDFADEIERLTMSALLLLLGAAFVSGAMGHVTPLLMALALVILLVIRPAAGMIGLMGCGKPVRDQLAISFFGIRGMGSFYYLAYALTKTEFEDAGLMWTIVSLVVVISIVLYGITATPVMQYLAEQPHPPDRSVDAGASDSSRGVSIPADG